ncbi:MAG: ParB N-terminal domain-containing protein [Candidatus Moraniibacteriota bacterium]
MASGKEVRVSPRSIRPLPNQPRKLFNHEGLLRLGHSMQLVGQIQPGIIRAVKAEVPIEYELLDGERRWRSAQMVELDYRATLIELDDDAVPWLIAAVANFNRESSAFRKTPSLLLPGKDISKQLV